MRRLHLPNFVTSNALAPARKSSGRWLKYILLVVIIRNAMRLMPIIVLYFIVSNTGVMDGILGNSTIGGVGVPSLNDGILESPSIDTPGIDSTPLIIASIAGDAKKVEQLLTNNTPINGRDSEQRTALIGAAYHEQNAICKRLIAAGANPYMQDNNGFNALDFAASRGLVDTVKLLLKESKNPDKKHHIEYAMIMQAAFSSNIDLLPKDKNNFRSVNRLSAEDKTPLHIAASSGSVDITNKLIKHGAKVNITNTEGRTPLHWAAWSNKPEIITLLLKNSAKIDTVDGDGVTPLMLATQKNNKETVALLLEKGADKTLRNKNGDVAATIAINKAFIELADILQKH